MEYYLYRHIRLDTNEVFYIGIGTKNRFNSKFSRNRYWNHITKVTKWEAEIVLDGLTREAAEEKEKEFILLYGRKDLKTGTLCNLTDGGTGGLGLKHTEEAKNKMKGRKSHNKGKSKWDEYEPQIIELILKGLSETKIKKAIGCSNGTIHRIKQKLKAWGGDEGIEWAQRKLEQIDSETNMARPLSFIDRIRRIINK